MYELLNVQKIVMFIVITKITIKPVMFNDNIKQISSLKLN